MMIPILRSIAVIELLNGRGGAVVGCAAAGVFVLVFGDRVPEGCTQHALLQGETNSDTHTITTGHSLILEYMLGVCSVRLQIL